ncbi:MAG: class II fructose-bisphosphate aldolase [Tepidanaerobacteraceae bacterium]|jgi:ketose-bisphosphate aldolase|nr:class II fructose-bisphosphate aldolase [Tepidanaerobacter sp.]HQA60740.1 class II fructose-bisphosphate aldolase [Tepidanaerobacteraceae bacterium]HQE06206.1 class II fructose-bisphosphate aldolase [Tepidanaerobacteraceae bacterium]
MLLSMTEMLKKARAGKYAIPQPDFVNIQMAAMYLEAAKQSASPIILGYGEEYLNTTEGVDLRHLVRLIEVLAKEYPIPVALHLDHGSSFEACAEAIAAGFTSVMFDGSSLPFEQNVAITRKVVEMAHPAGVSVEAELGYVGTAKDTDDDSRLTDPEKARIFVKATGVDALAVSIGTVHGEYKGKPNIRLDLLSEISAKVDVPLVLHGASGTGHDTLRECVKRGICKVNIYTDLVKVMIGSLKKDIQQQKPNIVTVIDNMHNEVVQELKNYIKTLGAAGRCN